jgi:hypothetical protein
MTVHPRQSVSRIRSGSDEYGSQLDQFLLAERQFAYLVAGTSSARSIQQFHHPSSCFFTPAEQVLSPTWRTGTIRFSRTASSKRHGSGTSADPVANPAGF